MRFHALLALALLQVPTLPAQNRAITVEDYLALKNVGDPQISPDGKWVVYTIGTISLQDNKSTSRLWLANVATGVAKELSQGAGSDRSPRWSPDGQTIAFLSGREHGPQVWVMPAAGGAARRVSDLPDGVGEMYWMPSGAGFLVVSDVKWPKEQEIDQRNGAYPTGRASLDQRAVPALDRLARWAPAARLRCGSGVGCRKGSHAHRQGRPDHCDLG